jgi:hypothetical protein
MLAVWWVTLKQHRFELSLASLAAVAAAAIGISILVRIGNLGVSQACLDIVQASLDGSGVDDQCMALVRTGVGIIGQSYLSGEGTIAISIMGALPFLVGLLGGVPIVSRELESRTAQTAWSLNASRLRWLGRQSAPVALLLGVLMAFAAVVATTVADLWVRWAYGGWSDVIGLHGPLAVVRAFGAFGIGLAVGALLGRTLPAFLFAVALTLAILFGLNQARDLWLAGLPQQMIGNVSPQTGEYNGHPGEKATGWVWIAPTGETLSADAARQLATEAGIPPPRPEDVQDVAAAVWLEEHGYVEVPLGVTDSTASGWALYDGLAFAALGVGGLAAAAFLVVRRRPT